MRRYSKRRTEEIGREIVLDWSWHDQLQVIGEIVFEPVQLKTVLEKLIEKFGFVPESVVEHDFGEVLNY